jgi:Na+-transporting NADH:ubiquinone oxidoreductase subunit A
MAVHTIKKGLDLPISGEADRSIEAAPRPAHVAVLAADYPGLKPTLLVEEGDQVKRGQALIADKRGAGIVYTAPAAGEVVAINRGARRALQSVVIAVQEQAGDSAEDQVTFSAYTGRDVDIVGAEEATALLLESGLWTALRTRPFSKVPLPGTTPRAIFVTAMDTNPLAPPIQPMLEGREADLNAGLTVLKKLTPGRVYVCKDEATRITPSISSRAQVEVFAGPHPAGNVGTHIHFLEPVSLHRVVWHIGVQDVLAIGKLFRTGRLDVGRLIAFAGPGVKRPRLLRTRLGASTDAIVQGELYDAEMRVLSGSVLSGRAASGAIFGYLGRFHQQISVIREGREREFLGWLAPGADKFSITSAFLSRLMPDRKFDFTTSTNGSPRAIVPIGLYERVMPLDILPTFLLKSLAANDIERAQQLGCLELDEEDLALCTFVCPGKSNFGEMLRRNLDYIEKEEL